MAAGENGLRVDNAFCLRGLPGIVECYGAHCPVRCSSTAPRGSGAPLPAGAPALPTAAARSSVELAGA